MKQVDDLLYYDCPLIVLLLDGKKFIIGFNLVSKVKFEEWLLVELDAITIKSLREDGFRMSNLLGKTVKYHAICGSRSDGEYKFTKKKLLKKVSKKILLRLPKNDFAFEPEEIQFMLDTFEQSGL